MRTLALGATLLALSLPCRAGDEVPWMNPLTWADVVARVGDVPQVAQAGALAATARDAVRLARSVPGPETDLRLGRGMPRGTGPDGLEWGVDVTVPLDWIAPRGAEVRSAKAEADAGHRDALQARRDVLARLSALFQKVGYDQELGEALAAIEVQVARLADVIRRRVEAGEARPTELPRIETELERVRIELERARADARADRGMLGVLLGLEPDAALRVAIDRDLPPDPGTRDQVLTTALDAHPGLHAARDRDRAARARIQAERARRLPGIAVGAFFERELDRDAAGALLRIRLPSWDLNAAGIRRARSEHLAADLASQAAVREVRAATGAAWERCVQGRDAAQRFAQRILPRAEAVARAVERAFDLGESALIDVLDARRMLLDTRKESLAAAFQARIACMDLRLLTGEDDAK